MRPPPTSTLFPYTTLFRSSSTKYAIARSERKTITLRLEPTQTRDKYKRLLAYVHLADNETLNLALVRDGQDRKSTRLNSSHLVTSYAVFCLTKKKELY